MRVTRFGAHLAQLDRFPRLFPVSCYLVREDDGFTLIDASIAGSTSLILQAARSLGGEIRRIAITHPHVDHVGALDDLCRALPDAELFISARDYRIVRGDRSLDPGEPQASIKGGWPTLTTAPTRELRDGDRVGSLEVFATPGHTPGSLCYFDPRDGSLLAGDALQTRAGLAVAGVVRWLFPFPAMATWHGPTAARSAAKLLDLRPTLLAPGHGPVLRDPVPALRRAVGEAHQKADLPSLD
jgi:glyoxylase-like metal-dependent hydrolase (beta-lactamase superfamily II)